MSSVSRSLAGVVLNFEAGLNLNLAPVPVGEGVMVGEVDRTRVFEPSLQSCTYSDSNCKNFLNEILSKS